MANQQPLLEPDPPLAVRRPVMTMRWDLLTFIHWRVPVGAVEGLLPDGLRVSVFDGSAWVGLVPFLMNVSFPVIGGIPGVSVFPETNVRTYVEAEDGSPGIWFFSLDADRASAVVAARIAYRLPYMWSSMNVAKAGDIVTYDCVRRVPGPRGARSECAVRIGDPFAADELGDLDHWLTGRWRLYSVMAGRVWRASADHPRWPLHRAELLTLDDELVAASGLPSPIGAPLVHYAPGVPVRISTPRPVRPLPAGLTATTSTRDQ